MSTNQPIATSPWLRYLAAMCVLPAAVALRSSAQDAATPEKKIPVENAPAATTPAVEEEELLVLSPFTVSTKQDIGYRASNTLAGSRLNSKVDDLASPITVVTKQQLQDTAARDLNDVFLYEANTEGALNYTRIQVDRSGIKDTIGGSATNGIMTGGAATAQTANRIRGLVSADMTWNYYPSLARVRGSMYNADSLEISRGPNSILAGLGSPAGILNQSLVSGHINLNTNEVNLAIGSFGSYRTSLSTNQTLIKDKLAIFVGALYDDRRFERKPSYDISKRQSGGFTFKPFKTTTIKGFAENFNQNSRLPNQETPRDAVSPWLASGKPVWDPLTRQVTYLDGGAHPNSDGITYLNYNTQLVATNALNPTQVRITGDAVLTDRRSSNFVPGLGFVNTARPVREVSPDGSSFWTQTQAGVFNIYPNPSTPASALLAPAVTGSVSAAGVFTAPTLGMGANSPYDIWSRKMTGSATLPAPAAYDIIGGGVYIIPAVSSKSIYDWQKINIMAANHGEMRNGTYNLEFEQQITPDLFFSAGWFRQDLDSLENYTLNQTTPASISIDTNKNLPNGQTNPNYLRPYIDILDPDTAQTPESNEVYRAMLAYNLDFTKNNGWSKWLGRHRLLGFVQHWDDIQTTIRSRLAFEDPSDPRFVTSLVALGGTGGAAARAAGYRYSAGIGQGGATMRQAYYLGGPVGSSSSIATSAPAINAGNPALGTTQTATISSYNYQTGVWENAPVTYGAEIYDAGQGFQRNQRVVNTANFTLQSYWWEDRIITTVGTRHDKWMGRSTTTATDANGRVLGTTATAVNSALYPAGSWRLDEGTLLNRWASAEFLQKTTGSMGIVVKPLPWFSLTANKSDNFNPPSSPATNIFKEKLPIPTGKSKDFGFGLNLLQGKLSARVTFFETSLQNDRSNGDITTALSRLVRMDNSNLLQWAQAVVRIRSNMGPLGTAAPDAQTHALNGSAPNTDWLGTTGVNALTQGQTDQVNALMGGLSSTWPDGINFNSTQNAKAKGTEIEVVYNPLPNWNIKITAAKQETTYTNIFPEYEKWLAFRQPVWNNAVALDTANPANAHGDWIDANGKAFSLTRFISGYGFGETNAGTGTNGYNPDDWYTKVVAPGMATARTLEGAAPYGQRKYRANILTNYLFTRGVMRNVGVGGAIRWEDKAVVGYRGKMGTDTRTYDTNGVLVSGSDMRTQWLGADSKSPVYDTDLGVDAFKDLTHFDFWVSYTFKMWSEKVRTRIQFNLTDAFEGGRLAPIYINYDGTPAAFRIVDSRRWELSAKFEF